VRLFAPRRRCGKPCKEKPCKEKPCKEKPCKEVFPLAGEAVKAASLSTRDDRVGIAGASPAAPEAD
jgi:hypothetical protein